MPARRAARGGAALREVAQPRCRAERRRVAAAQVRGAPPQETPHLQRNARRRRPWAAASN